MPSDPEQLTRDSRRGREPSLKTDPGKASAPGEECGKRNVKGLGVDVERRHCVERRNCVEEVHIRELKGEYSIIVEVQEAGRC